MYCKDKTRTWKCTCCQANSCVVMVIYIHHIFISIYKFVMALNLPVIFTVFVAFGALFLEDKVYTAEAEFHRTKRAVSSTFNIPKPTKEFPLVLFAGDNYNNESEGFIHRSRPNEYRVWARTQLTAVQEFVFRSLLVLPGWKLTFQACCVAGNRWTVSISNASNISSLHFYMFNNRELGEGIYYTQWLHWSQEFSVKAEQCVDAESCTSNVTCGQLCYFGSCGQDGHCQCKDGYSGDKCEIRPSDPNIYPSITFPLLLFPKERFQGTPVKVLPDSYYEFAKNVENKRIYQYLSARILFTRSITFSRNRKDDQKYFVSPGSDIGNLESYFASNMDIGQPLWLNYAKTIESQFYIKVEGNPSCTNCSEIGGSCYTGHCTCLQGFNGTYCSNKTT